MRGLIAMPRCAVERVFERGRSGLLYVVYLLLEGFFGKKQGGLHVGYIFFSLSKLNCFNRLVQSTNDRIQRKFG